MNSGISSGFGKRICQLREKFGLSAPKFAALVGFDRSYVFRLENGEADNPSLKFIESIVEKFGVDREWLIGGVGDGKKLRVDVVPFRSGFGGRIRSALESLETIIEACSDSELEDALDRFTKLAESDEHLGKILTQIEAVIQLTKLRRAAEKLTAKKQPPAAK